MVYTGRLLSNRVRFSTGFRYIYKKAQKGQQMHLTVVKNNNNNNNELYLSLMSYNSGTVLY